ncbi:MAG: efflux RND transporter periplasmic adaptor subunit [Anaerolineae bacterium]|nr:efflux RND transporter periplasmic adaptor subunit [Anaerolineae bacterium]
MKHSRYIGLALILVVLLPACDMLSSMSGATPEATPAPAVQVVPMVSVTGELVPADWITIDAQVGGEVLEVLVEEGTVVEAGDLLVQLDDADARLAVEQAEVNLRTIQIQVAQAKVGPYAENIAVAAAQVAAAQVAVTQTLAARNQLTYPGLAADIAAAEAAVASATSEQCVLSDRYDDMIKCDKVEGEDDVCPNLGRNEKETRFALHAANLRLAAAEAQRAAVETQYWAQVKAAEVAVDVAQAQWEVSVAQWMAAQLGPRQEDIAVAEAAVVQAEVTLEMAQVALERTAIYAPIGGTVGKVLIKRGESIMPDQPLVTLGDLTTLQVETTDLDEIDVAKIRLEQEVVVTFDALPNQTFAGHVQKIAPMADSNKSSVNYEVIIIVDELDPLLRWGMTAFVDVEVE